MKGQARIVLKNKEEIARMREAGRLAAMALREVVRAVRPEVTTMELDEIAERYIRAYGGVPSFKGYRGYPASICVSINEEVVHGIPSKRRLKKGQIVSIDLGVIVDGFHGDVAVTVPVGEVSEDLLRLLECTREALYQGISQARPGNRLGDISFAIQACVERYGFSVVREYAGHGIGRQLHEEPQVPNYGAPGTGIALRPGMTLAIEPMVNLGGAEVLVAADGWTVRTRDGLPSAHFEHTVAIGEEGPEILTRLPGDSLI